MDKTLSDFMKMRVRRNGDVAEIIFDHDKEGRPVRLLGFAGDAADADFEIRKQGFDHYQELINEIKKGKL